MPTATLFASTFSGANGQATAEGVVNDSAGNTYVTGSFTGTITLGGTTLTTAGGADAYIAKLGLNGNVLWAKRMGSSANGQLDGDFGRGVAVDGSGNVYVTGIFTGSGDFAGTNLTSAGKRDAFVLKLSPSGNLLWAKNYGGPEDDQGQSIVVDPTGNVYTTGIFKGTANFTSTPLTSAGGEDAFVVKQDATSAVVNAVALGGATDDQALNIAYDSAGNGVFVTGDFTSAAQFGATSLTSAGDTDGFVARLNNTLGVVWAVRFGGSAHDDGVGVGADTSGNAYVTGDFNGSASFGSTTLTSTGQSDIFLMRVDGTGSPSWVRQVGGAGYDAGFSVAVDASNNVWTTGYFQNSATFGATTVTSNGDADVYLAKFDTNGNASFAQSFGTSTFDQPYQLTIGGPKSNITLVGFFNGNMNIGNFGFRGVTGGFVTQISQTTKTTPSKPAYDFHSVGYTQLSLFRTANAFWYAANLSKSVQLMNPNNTSGAFGSIQPLDVPVAGDFDGVGHTQLAVFRPSTAQWFVVDPMNPSSRPHLVMNPGNSAGTFGATNLFDIPVPGDYDGVGHTEMAVFRPSTGQWFVVDQLNPASRPRQLMNPGRPDGTFGGLNLFDIPVPGDYDGVGHTQMAVFRPSTAQWFVVDPLNPASRARQIMNPGRPDGAFGGVNFFDIPAPGDYLGLGYTQLAVFRPSTAEWFVLGPNGTVRMNAYGATNLVDIPTQAPAGALMRLGLVPGTRAPSVRAAMTTPQATTTSLAVAPAVAAAETKPMVVTTSAAPTSAALNTRPAVVVHQAVTQSSANPFSRRSLRFSRA